jgi:tRNA A37 N6-isopentenylltransferase MiaA
MQETHLTVVVVGTGGCGKTHHSKQLADAYGCKMVVDGWTKGDRLTIGALHLSNECLDIVPDGVLQVNFPDACRLAGINHQDKRTMQDEPLLNHPAL